MSDDLRVAAIRADSIVGAGSCSTIDECYSDAELAAELDRAGIRGAVRAVRWARRRERVWRDVADDIASA